MERNYFVEGLFILLGLALIASIIKYPKDVLLKLPFGILYTILVRPILWVLSIPLLIVGLPLVHLGEKYNWKITPWIAKLIDFGAADRDDKPHKATRKLSVDFANGDKYLLVIDTNKDIRELIVDFLDALTGRHLITDFTITESGDKRILRFPKDIGFYDYHLMVQYLNGELGEDNSFGLFKSSNLEYYVFQDKETVNNLVGFTSDSRYFSLYMFDDLDNQQYLKLNQSLKLDAEWIKRINGTTANTVYVP